MTSAKPVKEFNSQNDMADSGDDSDDDSQILEESPCGRWQKRKERVEQRDVPGIESAYLAMDTEEGMEVVWNEIFLADDDIKDHVEEIKTIFDNLTQLDHANLVKFHKYWICPQKNENIKLVFITEYMSSGSLKQFLSRAKNKPKTGDKKAKSKTLKAWKRWCTQILSALSYLHSCEPAIIHGNLTCESIYIQHNGLIKVGCVAPDAITKNLKTSRKDMKKDVYYFPDQAENVTTAFDIYSFGICALEMSLIEIQSTNAFDPEKNPIIITNDNILKILDSLEDKDQRQFIALCLDTDQTKRPSARELLFNKVLFEVHSLKLLAAHAMVIMSNDVNLPEDIWRRDPNSVIAEIKSHGSNEIQKWCVSDSPILELDKFLEDVRNGIYPLTAFNDAVGQSTANRTRATSPEVQEQMKSESPEIVNDVENRSCSIISCEIKQVEPVSKETNAILSNGHSENFEKTSDGKFHVHLVLKMEDKTNRDLQGEITKEDTAANLVQELVDYGFINNLDFDKVLDYLDNAMNKHIDDVNTVFPPSGAMNAVLC